MTSPRRKAPVEFDANTAPVGMPGTPTGLNRGLGKRPRPVR